MSQNPLTCVELFSRKFVVSSVLAGRYVVQRVLREGDMYQLLRTKDVVDGDFKIVRAVNRTTVSPKNLASDLTWLQSTRTKDGRHSEYCTDHRDSIYVYIVFRCPKKTLHDILVDDDIYISRRHVREMSRQILRGLRALHDEMTLHSDISPTNVEIVNDNMLSEFVYCENGSFSERTVLASTEIRICFYGALGLRGSVENGEDQYKSPEAVFGMRYTERSDVFSLGCLIFELVTRSPLFPRCLPGPTYRREKTILFDAILGPFPDDLIREIRSLHTGIFKTSTSDIPEVDVTIPWRIRHYAENAHPLRVLVSDEVALDLIESMVYLDSRDRILLRQLDRHPFFKTSC